MKPMQLTYTQTQLLNKFGFVVVSFASMKVMPDECEEITSWCFDCESNYFYVVIKKHGVNFNNERLYKVARYERITPGNRREAIAEAKRKRKG